MYYSFPTKNCKNKKRFIQELVDLTGWPTQRPEDGRSPFVETNRFSNDVTLSRITRLSDEERERVILAAEEIAEGYF